MKFFDWNENKIDINLFITQFEIRFFLYLSGSSQTDDPGKYKKVLSELIEHAPICKNPKLYKETGAIPAPVNNGQHTLYKPKRLLLETIYRHP